jgi:hypothetical protein
VSELKALLVCTNPAYVQRNPDISQMRNSTAPTVGIDNRILFAQRDESCKQRVNLLLDSFHATALFLFIAPKFLSLEPNGLQQIMESLFSAEVTGAPIPFYSVGANNCQIDAQIAPLRCGQ